MFFTGDTSAWCKSKTQFANELLSLLQNGDENSPWAKCGYLNAAGMTLPLLDWQTADAHTHNKNGDFGGCDCGQLPAGTADDPYLISNAEELKRFRDMVNGGNTGICAKLMNDIDLGNEAWTPVNNYSGTFDGNGKTIKGLYVTGVSEAGLFATLNGSAAVKNLTVAGAVEASNTNGDAYAGSIAAKINGYAQIINCTNNAMVKAAVNNDVDVNYTAYTGGIAGYASGSYVFIENCLNTVELSAVAGTSHYLSDGVTEPDYIESNPDCERGILFPDFLWHF